jgi:hypothetical protein
MSFEERCKECQDKLGKRYEDIHHWLEECGYERKLTSGQELLHCFCNGESDDVGAKI